MEMTPRQPTPTERDALIQYARTEISLKELCRLLDGMLTIEFGARQRSVASSLLPAEPGIRIDKETIHNALAQYDAGRITRTDLSHWASILLMVDAYVWNGPHEDEITDALYRLTEPEAEFRQGKTGQ